MIIKKRLAKKSERGLYLQDRELKDTVFQPGTAFRYVVDVKRNKIILLTSDEETKNTVSKRKLKNGELKPVLDFRNKKVLNSIFKDNEYLQVTILEDRVIVEGYEKSDENQLNKAFRTIKGLLKRKVTDITQIISVKKKFEVHLSRTQLEAAAGGYDFGYSEQLSILDDVYGKKTAKNIKKSLKIPFIVSSFCSGAGMMDKAFKDGGFDIIFGLEIDKNASISYRHNIGEHVVQGDLVTYDRNSIPPTPIKISGTPCFGFSNNNRISHSINNPNNLLLREYIDIIKRDRTTQVFLIENVPQIFSAGNGLFKNEIFYELGDEFEITAEVCNSADYGDPQIRQRAIIIGSKIGKINIPKPIYSKENYRTVADAFRGLNDSIPNQKDYTKPSDLTELKMSFVPQGGNIKDIPEELRPKGGHSDVYRRLRLDKPSITIVNPRKSNITHPLLNRSLSVRESARIQSVKDDFVFKGPLSSMQMQVANGVPLRMMTSIAQEIKKAIENHNNNCASLSY